jgi:hypothetical protein
MNAAGIQTNRANVRIVWLKVAAEKRGAERHQSSIGCLATTAEIARSIAESGARTLDN